MVSSVQTHWADGVTTNYSNRIIVKLWGETKKMFINTLSLAHALWACQVCFSAHQCGTNYSHPFKMFRCTKQDTCFGLPRSVISRCVLLTVTVSHIGRQAPVMAVNSTLVQTAKSTDDLSLFLFFLRDMLKASEQYFSAGFLFKEI